MNPNKVGIIGGGVMGVGIAQLALLQGHEVILIEDGGVDKKSVTDKILYTLTGYLEKMVKKNKLTSEKKNDCLSRLVIDFDIKHIADSSLIIEAVTENLSLKQSLLLEVEKYVSRDALITSNTSTLSITSLARVLQQPDRLVGLHFFNPPVLMKLVEVVKGLTTSKESVGRARLWVEKWGKQVVVSGSSPGFIVNRIARPYYCESLSLLDERVASPATLDALLVGSGVFPIGVFSLIDLIGMDTNYRNTEEMFHAYHYPKRFKPSNTQREYVEAGWWGRKSNRGFYIYGEDGQKETDSPSFYQPVHASIDINNFSIKVKGNNPILKEIAERLKRDHQIKVEEGLKDVNDDSELILNYRDNGKLCKLGLIPSQGKIDSCDHPRVMLDLIINFDKMTAVALSALGEVTPGAKDMVFEMFRILGKKIVFIPPTPGMVIERILLLIIDEAIQAIGEGVCNNDELDLAMSLGMNFHRQPCELMDELSPQYVYKVLKNLQLTTGSDKYRPSSHWLKKIL